MWSAVLGVTIRSARPATARPGSATCVPSRQTAGRSGSGRPIPRPGRDRARAGRAARRSSPYQSTAALYWQSSLIHLEVCVNELVSGDIGGAQPALYLDAALLQDRGEGIDH